MGRGFEPPPGHACPPREVLESCAVLVFHALEHGMRLRTTDKSPALQGDETNDPESQHFLPTEG